MTRAEKILLVGLLRDISTVGVTGAIFDANGYRQNHKEAVRRLDSADYWAGYLAVSRKVFAWLKYLDLPQQKELLDKLNEQRNYALKKFGKDVGAPVV